MDSIDVAFSGIARQAEMLVERELSSVELTELYLDRIERLDAKLNAFRIVLGDEALASAREADGRLAAGERAPLLGVPVALKDELDQVGQVSTHGTAAFDAPATADCEIVRRLRTAGAVIIGRTNLPELAIVGFTETDAWGVTRNPWDAERTPGGSSGGSGAAVAAGFVGAASASDGAGSIRIPAANNHLFGLKPQRGRLSLAPLAEHWHGLSAQGCETRRVVDTALWLDATAGNVAGDADRPPPPERPFVEAARASPGRLRIAWSVKAPRGLLPARAGDHTKGAVESMAATLRDLGHSVEQRDPDWGSAANPIIPRYLNGIAEEARTVPHPERLEAQTRGFVRLGRPLGGAVARRARRAEARDAARIGRIFERADVLMTPTTAVPPVRIGEWRGKSALRAILGMSRAYPFTVPWNHLGWPAASVPAGFTLDGLPLAVQLISPEGREDRLLSLAAQIEAETGWSERRPPDFG